MAEITTHVDHSKELTIHTIVGVVTGREILDKVREVLEGTPTRFVIWDFSAADVTAVSRDAMEQAVGVNKALGGVRRGGKTALILTSDLAFGLGRVYETLMQLREAPFELQAFRSLEEAGAWLGIDLT